MSSEQDIQGGQFESGYPAIGEVLLASGSFCTGTVIAPSYVLTAAHCASSSMVFYTGTDPTNLVGHPIDQQIAHPTQDLLIAHLATPIAGTSLSAWSVSAPPPVGTVCTAVGYGRHDGGGVTSWGTKRSATEQVTSSSASLIAVTMVTGIADKGDSGGPLLCGGDQIAAVVKGHSDGEWPAHTAENYTTIDPAWISSVIAPTWTPLALQNGWTHAPFGTRSAAVASVGGMVHLRGAIAGGSSSQLFTLPVSMRPATSVYVPVDLCNATTGRLTILPSGAVSVQSEAGTLANASCFTSLEGVEFAPSTSSFTPLALQNGWTSAPFSTSIAAAANIAGIVHLKGAIAGGSSSGVFTLPIGLRPSAKAYVSVDLCGATNGRLVIDGNGMVTVEQEGGGLTAAACFTSLDGVSFPTTVSGFSTLVLQNGWTNGPYGTGSATAANIGGIVQLKGAIGGGGAASLFTLPAGLRPSATTYVPVNLCGSTNGRLVVQPSGVTTVQTESGTLANAQCFTSLDGVAFAQ